MRTLVTGGAGFIGSNLARRLAADGRDVVVADTFAEGHWTNLVEFARLGGDVVTLDSPLDLDPIRQLEPFEAVFHQAAVTGVIGPDGAADTSPAAERRILQSNLEQFRSICDLCVKWGASLVWASSCSVYGRGPVPMKETAPPDPLNVYAFSKVMKESLARRLAAKLSYAPIGLRYSNVYGPGEDHKGKLASMIHQLAKQMRAGKQPRVFEHGDQRRDFVYVDDVVEANLLAEQATRHGQVAAGKAVAVNAGAGRSWSFNDVIASLNKVLGTSLEPDYFRNPYAFTQDHTETDNTLATRTIGYESIIGLDEGIQKYHASGTLGVSSY